MKPLRIFVQMASYRDPECAPTIADLYAKARHPERIFIGLVWQARAEDGEPMHPDQPHADQVRLFRIAAERSRGACWARHLAQTLWQGEEFFLQIDSHMRFEPDWDEHLFEQWQTTNDARALLSSYPAAYEPPDTRHPCVTRMVAKGFNHEGILSFDSRILSKEEARAPLPGAFISAGFLFGPAAAIREVPYDPLLYFVGEEISLAARLWTHGWNPYSPSRVIVYHWYRKNEPRPLHWSDHPDWTMHNRRAVRRIRHQLGAEPCDDPEVLRDLARYALGQRRSLAAYEAYAGIDFARQTLAPHALYGPFGPHPAPFP